MPLTAQDKRYIEDKFAKVFRVLCKLKDGNIGEGNNATTSLELEAAVNIPAESIMTLNSSSQWELASATALSTASGLLAFSPDPILQGEEGLGILSGLVTVTSPITPSQEYYISTSLGLFTSTAPADPGEIVRIIGYGVTSGSLLFSPDITFIEL